MAFASERNSAAKQPEGLVAKSDSLKDVIDVLPASATRVFSHTPPRPELPRLPRRARRHSGRDLIQDAQHARRAVQEHENDDAEVVIVCEPEGTSLMMGGLHPRASLYERPVNLDAAKAAHAEFRRVMREHGVKVLTVRDVLSYGTGDHVGARVELEELAAKALRYELAEGAAEADFREEDRYFLTPAYRRTVLEHMSVAQLIDTILINPTVRIAPSYRDTGLSATYTFQPLSNLVYTRDQQITTCKGVVMGRLRSEQRQMEVELMRFCHQKLGLPVVGEIQAPGFLEGGDFFPAGPDLALVGVGLRSSVEAAEQLMREDLLGCGRLAVVRDEFEQHQDRMHLDCVFSILGDKCCLMLEELMGEESPTRRLVDEYTRQAQVPGHQSSGTGAYVKSRENVEFSRYMRENGYHIIPISAADQLLYGCNCLNLGSGKVLSVNANTARQIVRDKHFEGDVQIIDFGPITSMYGAVHCSSQVVRRKPRPGLADLDISSSRENSAPSRSRGQQSALGGELARQHPPTGASTLPPTGGSTSSLDPSLASPGALDQQYHYGAGIYGSL